MAIVDHPRTTVSTGVSKCKLHVSWVDGINTDSTPPGRRWRLIFRFPSKSSLMSSPTCIEAQSLRPLHSVAVVPSRINNRSQSVVALRNVKTVHVGDPFKLDGHRYYVIHIAFKEAHTPSIKLRRRFADFLMLRHEIQYQTHDGHTSSAPCAFCTKFMEYTMFDSARPTYFTRVMNNDERTCKLLTQFVQKLLEMTTEAQIDERSNCMGQRYIPTALKNFLTPASSATATPTAVPTQAC